MVLCPGPTWLVGAGLATLQSSFFLAQWEEYHKGVLNTAIGPVGITEIEIGLALLSFGAGVLGPENLSAFTSNKVVPPWSTSGEPIPFGLVAVQFWVIGSTCYGSVYAFKTLWFLCTSKRSGLCEALGQVIPVLSLNILMLMFNPLAFHYSMVKMCLIPGLIFFYYTAQMIVFSMAKMSYPVVQLDTLLPYGALALSSWVLSPAHFDIVMSVALLNVIVYVLLWLVSVIEELKEKFGIYLFSLEKPSKTD